MGDWHPQVRHEPDPRQLELFGELLQALSPERLMAQLSEPIPPREGYVFKREDDG